MGKPLTPGKIHFVSALPKTRNAKVMRRVIRSAYLGEDPGDLSALEDLKSIEEIWNIADNCVIHDSRIFQTSFLLNRSSYDLRFVAGTIRFANQVPETRKNNAYFAVPARK
jgi:hypothetical protein